MKVNVYGASSVGKVRKLNEDSFSFDSSRGDKGSIFLVCDGMGGHKAGEIASQYASIKVVEYFYKSPQKDIPSKLNESIRKVNKEIYNLSQKDSSKRGMGTTLVAIVLFENILYYANVGDSRAYLLRNESIKKLTKDHSWLEEKISEGILSSSEARNSPNKNIITKCVGYDSDVEPNFGSIVLKEGDRLILCSDGLWDELIDFKIKELALSSRDLKKSVESLIGAAERNGGKDNITVVGVDYGKVKINIINKNKNLILLSVISIIAIFFIVFSAVTFYFYNKARKENNNYQKNNIELEKEKIVSEKEKDSLEQEKNELSESVDTLEKEIIELNSSITDLQEELNEAGETSQINSDNNINLELNNFFNLNDSYLNLGVVKRFFVYENNFLLFLNRENTNELFLLKLKNVDIDPNSGKNTSTKYVPIKFRLPENDVNLEISEFIFNNNSDSFFIISGNYAYKGNRKLLFLSEGSVNVEKVSDLSQVIPGNELGKYLVIGDYLYYFNFDNTLKNIQFYDISNSDTEITPSTIFLENINYNVSSMDVNFGIQNKKLYILLKSGNENYLYVLDKAVDGFGNLKVAPLESKYGLPNKILINDTQTNGGVLINFENQYLNSYDENLEFLNHYVFSVISEPDKNIAVLEIKDVFVDSGKLYLIDNSNNIYSTDLQQ